MERDNRIYVYGLTKDCQVERHEWLIVQHDTDVIFWLKMMALNMRAFHPGITDVYAAHQSYPLYEAWRDYKRAHSMEENIAFKDFLQRVGIRL